MIEFGRIIELDCFPVTFYVIRLGVVIFVSIFILIELGFISESREGYDDAINRREMESIFVPCMARVYRV